MKTKILFILILLLFFEKIAYSAINGFQFNGIKGVGGLELSDRIGKSAGSTEHIINIEDCYKYQNGSIKIIWSLNRTPIVGTKYVVKMSKPDGSCSTSNLTELGGTCHEEFIVSEKTLENPFNNEFTVALNTLIYSDCAAQTDKTTNIYIVMDEAGQINSETIPFKVDLKPPHPPEITEIEEGDQSLNITWKDPQNEGEKNIKYVIYYSEEKFDNSTKANAEKSSKITAKTYKISNLKNDTKYYIAVCAIDKNDNEGIISTIAEAIPVESMDFFELYKSMGGMERGGFCAFSLKKTSRFAFFVFIILFFISFMILKIKKKFFFWTIFLFFPSLLYAESPQNMAIELKFGPYRPDVDNEFSEAFKEKPFEKIFGEGSSLMSQFEIDYQLFKDFGTIAIGGTFGYFRAKGNALLVDKTEKSKDTTSLSIIPLGLLLVYKFDVLAKKINFPFVPFGKAGFNYYIWWIRDGVGDIAKWISPDGKEYEGKGGTFGYSFSFGINLLLDFFAPSMAQVFDVEIGVNNTYLFIEYLMAYVDDFGNVNSIILNDKTFLFGIAFEF